MLNAPIPQNESERLASLKSLNVLDTPLEERFERITRIAQKLFDVPISTISLIDGNREWFKSCRGLDTTEGPRLASFCGHAMLADDLFVIPDTVADPRFYDNPMVVGKPYIRFYAGQSLLGPGGHKIGTLCIKDCKPRNFSQEHLQLLKDLAMWAEVELNSQQLSRAVADRRENEVRLNAMLKDLQETHEELKRAQTHLLHREKLASIGQLAAGVAHEINNPVGFISNNMEVLEDYMSDYRKILHVTDQLKEEIRRGDLVKAKSLVEILEKTEQEMDLEYTIKDIDSLIRHNQKGAERIKRIVEDLRTFAREDNNEMESVKIERVLDNVLSIVENELKYKAEVKKNYGHPPLIKANVQRLGQVFINLLLNAMQAIPEKGMIGIRTYSENDAVCVDITDNGTGIQEQDLNRIFDPFFTTKPVGQGTGLGLSVSYEIIKKHGGTIKVQSVPGKGTVFTVILPKV